MQHASVNNIVNSIKTEKAEENKKSSKDNYKKRSKGKLNVKPGIEVALTSPKSEEVVALGTVQRVGSDDHIQVLINLVLRRTTSLPEAKGRMTLLGHEEAHSVKWPMCNVSSFPILVLLKFVK